VQITPFPHAFTKSLHNRDIPLRIYNKI